MVAIDLFRGQHRIIALDFLRGCALILVAIDHTEGINGINFLRRWTLRGIGFSDTAEAFVFLSGITFGWVYTARLLKIGLFAALRKALVRSLQIYGAYMLSLAIVLMIAFRFNDKSLRLDTMLNLDESFANHMLAATLLLNEPFCFEILPVYILILPFLPLPLFLFSSRKKLTISLSFSLYVFAQMHPDWIMPRTLPSPRRLHFNPLAWQFLFVIGLAFGSIPIRRPTLSWISCSLTIASCALILMGFLKEKLPAPIADQLSCHIETLLGLSTVELIDKTQLSPLRLLHFLSVAWIVFLLFGKPSEWYCHRSLSAISKLGEFSLLVYSLSIIWAYLSIPVFLFVGASSSMVLLVHLDFVLLSWTVCLLVGLRGNPRLSRSRRLR